MRLRFVAWLMCCITSLGAAGPALDTVAKSPALQSASPSTNLGSEIKKLSDQVAEIRRDQLTYQIERDLLEEAYSSNLQTVQLVLTMILGAFTIFGYLGFRSIGSLRQAFQEDLVQFRTARTALETELNKLQQAQQKAETQVQRLEAENQEQDRRLRGLEIREKAATLISQNNYALALEYILVGLQLTPDDLVMTGQKAICLGRLGRISEATVTREAILKAKPDDVTNVLNLMELYLLSARTSEFDKLVGARPEAIQTYSKPDLLSWYFEAIKILFANDLARMQQHVMSLGKLVSHDKSEKTKWLFDEARASLSGRKDLLGSDLFWRAIHFLDGDIDGAALFGPAAGVKQ